MNVHEIDKENQERLEAGQRVLKRLIDERRVYLLNLIGMIDEAVHFGT